RRRAARASPTEQLGNPEIDELRKNVAVLHDEEDVVGLQIAVSDPRGVGGVEGACERSQDRDRGGHVDTTVVFEIVAQGFALEELHHEVVTAVVEDSEREDVDDVAMLDAIDRAGLGDETRHHLTVGAELAVQYLDGDRFSNDGVHALVDASKAALAELLLHTV